MPSPAIGIDIGHTAVRAVAIVRTKQGYAVTSHAALPRHDASGDPRPLPVLLSELDSLIGLRRGDVTIADSAHTILVRFVSTIPMPATAWPSCCGLSWPSMPNHRAVNSPPIPTRCRWPAMN